MKFTDMGILRVDVIDAKALHGADRSGKSDVSTMSILYAPFHLWSTSMKPYVVFTLNGMKVFKSETKRK